MATSTLRWAPQVNDGDVVHGIYGDASRSLIQEEDVAVHALSENGHGGKKYLVTGPEVLTQVEQLQIIGEITNRPLRFSERCRCQAQRTGTRRPSSGQSKISQTCVSQNQE